MGIVDSMFDAFGGTLQDQWKDIVTAGDFDEHTLVAPGVRKRSQNGRGNNYGAEDILANGSMIFVPEGTAAFIFSQGGIEEVITAPGGYEYRNGQATVFDTQDRADTGIGKAIFGQALSRIGFSGMSADEKRVAFVNCREIRNVRFGTRGPLVYNDRFYGCDLEIFSYGTFCVQICDATRFVRSFLPANTSSYSIDSPKARAQLTAEFLHSFIAAVNALSRERRIAELPSQANAITQVISGQDQNAATWPERFGMKLTSVAIENIEFSDESRELVRGYAKRKMDVAAYEGISEQAANIAAQQLIAAGVRDNGFGEAGNMLFGMGLASSLNPRNASVAASAQAPTAIGGFAGRDGAGAGGSASGNAGANRDASAPSSSVTLDEQIEGLKKLKELMDAGILTQEEFDAKKRQVMGL